MRHKRHGQVDWYIRLIGIIHLHTDENAVGSKAG